MKIITKQGKEFELSDVLLYSVNKNKIITIVNDEEQMKKFSITGSANDAPISIIDYSEDTLNEIITSMKQIKSYQVSDSKDIDVEYTDGTSIMFDESNMEVINSNLQAQKKANEKKTLGAWYDLSDKEKEEKKRKTKKNVLRGLSAAVAATVLAGGLYVAGKTFKRSKPAETVGEIVSEEMYNPTDPRKTTIVEEPKSDFTNEAASLYKETEEVNPFIIRYQQAVNVTWNKELALEVVEFLNGMYPTSMIAMNEENSKAEATELMQAIDLIIAGNLNPETSEEEMIDLSKYIRDEKERVFVHNSMLMARACINESIGEPMNGKILDESKWSDVNKFSREYTNSVEQLIHYEFDTLNDSDFLTSSANTRYVITSIFQVVDASIPQWTHVTRRSSEQDVREYELYYRYFFDDVDKVTYLPEPGKNGTNQYRAYWADGNSLCNENGPFTEDEMHAMAGLSTVEEQRNLGIEANPNIHQLGVQTQINAKYEQAIEDFLALRNDYVKNK